MTDYNILNKPGRKKMLLSFCLVFLVAIAFFYINSARMDDFTSLITEVTLQYETQGVMKDYTSDIKLENHTALTFTIKATIPQGTLASIETKEVKNQTLSYNLPEQLELEDIQTNKLYLEDDLVHSIGAYEIKDNILTMYFDDVSTNAETDLKLALVLDTNSSHVIYDTNGSSLISFNTKNIELNKYIEQPQVIKQIDEKIVEVKNNTNVEVSTTTNTLSKVSKETTVEPKCGTATDFGPHITSTTVSKLNNGQWVESTEFEEGDQVKVHIGYNLPANTVTKENDSICYQLPEGVKPLKKETGSVYASNGKVVGTYIIDTNGKITIEFNDDYANSEPFSGYIEFEGTVTADGAGDNGNIKFDGAGGSITIKPNKSQYDLNVSKQGTLQSNGQISYTITASSTKGTEGPVNIKDSFVNWDTATGSYNKESFKVVKVDSHGNKTNVSASPNINGDSFTIDNLPQLKAGESYEIIYTANASSDSKDGSGALGNSVKVTSGNISKESGTWTTISNAVVSKYGGYDYNTGKMNWTITINPDKKNISGYTLTDKIQDGLTLPSSFTLKKSDGTSETIQLPYTFPEGFQDTYTIEYQTDAPKENGNVNNTAYFSKGDKYYESGATVGVWQRDWNLSKSMISSTVDKDSQTMKNKWQAYITLPNKEITSVTYSDVIQNGTSKKDTDFNGEHYAILSELKQEILNNIQLKNQDGNVVSNEELDIDIKFYSDEEKKNKVTNDNAHVKAFEVTVKKKDGSSFIGQSLNISSYSTMADLSNTQEGIDYYFSNKGIVKNKTSTSSVTYNKPKKIVKQGYGQAEGENYNKYTADKVNTNYVSQNGKLHYRILFTPDSNEEYSFTDTLPKGTKLVETALRSDYKTSTYKSNPADRSSPEAVYYFSDSWEQYCDGDLNNTDISKYFKHSYDQSTNKVTFTFMPGYNRTDGDWSTNRNNPNGAIAVYYAVDITNDEFWNDLKNESKNYSNTLEYEGKKQTQHTEVNRETQNVSKTAKQIENTTNVEYSVVINPAAKDLNPTSDKFTLVDQLSHDSKITSYLNLSKLKLYEYDSKAEDHRGNIIDVSRYQMTIDESTHKLTITIPDELACVLVYEYDFDVANLNDPYIQNNISLNGQHSSGANLKIDTHHASAGVVKGKIIIYKVDSKDYSKKLEGAKFRMWKFNTDTHDWDVVTYEGESVFVTNKDGELVFAQAHDDSILEPNTLYKFEEVEAPSGYDKENKIYYFSLYNASENKTKLDAIDALNASNIGGYTGLNTYSDISYLPNNKAISVYVPNNSNSISVKKVWVDSDNKETTDHPSSIKLNLIQNIQTPTGVNVNTYIYTKYDWETSNRVIDNQTLVVKEGGSIKMTLPVSCVPGQEANVVTVEGATDYSFSNDNQYWGHAILTINNVTPDMNLRIKLNDAGDYQVKYDYDKEYETTKNVVDTVTLNDSNNWSHTWTKASLPKKVDGKDCIYTVEEEVLSGFQVSYTNNDGILEGDITVTNKKLDSTELPDTGGIGNLGYYAIGALFVTATLLVYIVNLRKKGASNP